MTLFASDALILRTWPVIEADLVVSFFTRDYGKIKGVAKAGAQKPQAFWRCSGADDPGSRIVC